MTQHTTARRRARFGTRVGLISLGLTGVGMFATTASTAAHTPTVKHTCSSLSVSLVSYEGPASNNTITVTIDGVPATFPFATAFSRTFPWSEAADHTYTIAIDANIHHGEPKTYDTTFAGAQERCPAADTTTPPTTTPPTSADVTTTTAAVTTTAAPAADQTTTTALASQAPIAATTTTAATAPAAAPELAAAANVAVEAPAPGRAAPGRAAPGRAAPGSAAPAAAQALPATGSHTGLQLGLGFAALLAGAGLVTFTRRDGRGARNGG